MNIDDLFTPDAYNASEALVRNCSREYFSCLKYPDWVVDGIQNGFESSFAIELNHSKGKYPTCAKFPDGRLINKNAFNALPDEKFFIWLSERISIILDASLVPHSNVCFDIRNFRRFDSLIAFTFVKFPLSPAQFFKTIYQVYSLGRYCSECLHLDLKMRWDYYTPEYNTSGDMTVDIDSAYMERIYQLCEFVHLIETFNIDTTKPEFEKFDHYQNYFKFKLFGRKIPFYLRNPAYIINREQSGANDIHNMLKFIRDALESFNIFALSNEELNHYFINESMMFMRLFQKKLFKRKNILNGFWKECAKELRKKCEDDIFDYVRERI